MPQTINYDDCWNQLLITIKENNDNFKQLLNMNETETLSSFLKIKAPEIVCYKSDIICLQECNQWNEINKYLFIMEVIILLIPIHPFSIQPNVSTINPTTQPTNPIINDNINNSYDYDYEKKEKKEKKSNQLILIIIIIMIDKKKMKRKNKSNDHNNDNDIDNNE